MRETSPQIIGREARWRAPAEGDPEIAESINVRVQITNY